MPTKAKKTVLYSSDPESESDNEEIPPKSELTEPIVTPVNLPKVEPLGKTPELTEPPFEAGLEIGKGKKAKRGRPSVEGAPAVVKPEKKPLPCSYCGKEYQTLFNLQRHLNDNRCPIKNDQDKKAFEKQQAMALEMITKSKKGKLTVTHKEEQVEKPKKPRKASVSPKDGASQKKEVQEELPEQPVQKAPAVPAPQQFTAPAKPRVMLRFG